MGIIKKLIHTNSSSTNKNRGRIQSQGGGIEDSESWNQSSYLTCADGISKTNVLESRHNQTEKNLRINSFNAARDFIQEASCKGGVSHPVSKSFPVKNDKNGRRVDIEVIKGVAFI